MTTESKDNNPYDGRENIRYNLSEYCLVEPLLPEFSSESKVCSTVNYSENGVCIKLDGNQFSIGSTYLISIKALDSIRQSAEIVWHIQVNQEISLLGVKWL